MDAKANNKINSKVYPATCYRASSAPPRCSALMPTSTEIEFTVETQIVTFPALPLDCGVTLLQVDVAYETYGTLNADRSNAILVLHAFSGDAHAAGISPETGQPGWWDNMIGPGKAFDTDKYFVICSNVLGGCRGTTGPGVDQSRDRMPVRHAFPVITIGDMVRLQKMLVDSLGIERLLAVAGGSMGGMQALEWAVAYPGSRGGRHPHRHHRPAQRAADRLQRGGAAGHHGRSRLERRQLLRQASRPAAGSPWRAWWATSPT